MRIRNFAALFFSSMLVAAQAGADVDTATDVAPQKPLADAMEEVAEADENLDLKLGEDGETLGIVMLSDVLFAYGKADLTPDAIATLSAIADKLPWVEGVELVGHTDSVGSADFNEALGLARARSVLAWLEAEGHADEGGITAISAGEREPVAENQFADGSDNPEGRAKNRRVEFRIVEASAPAQPEAEIAASVFAPRPTTVQ